MGCLFIQAALAITATMEFLADLPESGRQPKWPVVMGNAIALHIGTHTCKHLHCFCFLHQHTLCSLLSLIFPTQILSPNPSISHWRKGHWQTMALPIKTLWGMKCCFMTSSHYCIQCWYTMYKPSADYTCKARVHSTSSCFTISSPDCTLQSLTSSMYWNGGDSHGLDECNVQSELKLWNDCTFGKVHLTLTRFLITRPVAHLIHFQKHIMDCSVQSQLQMVQLGLPC